MGRQFYTLISMTDRQVYLVIIVTCHLLATIFLNTFQSALETFITHPETAIYPQVY